MGAGRVSAGGQLIVSVGSNLSACQEWDGRPAASTTSIRRQLYCSRTEPHWGPRAARPTTLTTLRPYLQPWTPPRTSLGRFAFKVALASRSSVLFGFASRGLTRLYL